MAKCRHMAKHCVVHCRRVADGWSEGVGTSYCMVLGGGALCLGEVPMVVRWADGWMGGGVWEWFGGGVWGMLPEPWGGAIRHPGASLLAGSGPVPCLRSSDARCMAGVVYVGAWAVGCWVEQVVEEYTYQ